jgi:hypothetical protein
VLTGGRDDLGAGCACLIHRVRESADPHNNDGPRPRGGMGSRSRSRSSLSTRGACRACELTLDARSRCGGNAQLGAARTRGDRGADGGCRDPYSPAVVSNNNASGPSGPLGLTGGPGAGGGVADVEMAALTGPLGVDVLAGAPRPRGPGRGHRGAPSSFICVEPKGNCR